MGTMNYRIKPLMKSPVKIQIIYYLLPISIKDDYKAIINQSLRRANDNISDNIIIALIVAEDKRFFTHNGIDWYSICRAFWSTFVRGKLQGASTIEQQYVRTLTKRYEICARRKIREIILSYMISSTLPKILIAKNYLAIAYYGYQMNGIYEATAKMGIQYENASIHEAAAIIARLKYPEAERSTIMRQKLIEQRKIYILSQMKIGGDGLTIMVTKYNMPD
jgi:membrane peptidoglycan carboxypeptidase